MSASPVVPPGYSLEDVPDFLKPTAVHSRVVVEQPNGVDIAKVSSSSPNTIQVNEREQFGQPQLNHEETHVFQFSRNPAIVGGMEADLAAGKLPKTYAYGGADGLLQAQLQHKTIADFGPEQQAEMVRDYAAESKDAIDRGDAAKLDKLNRAYGPYLRQLANLPGKNESMTTMTQKDLTPAAPGLPPATLTGILEPLRVVGGNGGLQSYPVGQKPLNTYRNPEDEPKNVSFERNKLWIKPGPYVTKLTPQEEAKFREWIKENRVSWQDTPDSDYDMRGYWKALQEGKAKQSFNAWDHKMHFPDTWKTPYSGVFSRESIYAKPDAPHWVRDVLVDNQGRVIANETPKKSKPTPPPGYTLEP